MAHFLFKASTDPNNGLSDPRHQTRSLVQQLIISMLLGLGAFTTFCILRPKWPQFYYARKIRVRNASSLPDLPQSLLGWIPALWRITDREVLATAGLDAYVVSPIDITCRFLAFFKMAIKFLFISAILAVAVLVPIHSVFGDGKETMFHVFGGQSEAIPFQDDKEPDKHPKTANPLYLWVNLVFVYVFSGLAYYFLREQTREVVQARQTYLGNRATVTDKTIQLSGIPEKLRSEGILKEYLGRLKIGKVENITLCRQWQELDRLLDERRITLRKLEEAHTVHRTSKKVHENRVALPTVESELVSDMLSDEEAQPLLEGNIRHYRTGRPQVKLRFGRLKMRTKKVDAIDYYTMKLQRFDDKITEARRKEYPPTPLAFVTMDSVHAAQVAVQTLLDPTPGAMIAKQAPAPGDILWKNLYLSRTSRSLRTWSISIFVTFLSIFWLIPVTALAGLWNLTEIKRLWPDLADALEKHEALASLVHSFLPTLVLTLLNLAAPYLYDWLSQQQAMISQADVELSVISKNFFFTFFNLFLVFTITGTAFTFKSFWHTIKGGLRDTSTIATLLARAVGDLGPFYVNLIILQGLGLFPLRLLQMGTVTLYPITKYGAKTPRDYAELVQPSTFQYGFYLPQPILIYIICIVYSVLQRGVLILTFGLVYFVIGYFTYKYQLLYAMDHPRHSTGKVWPMIVYRVILGLIIFQLTMAGWLALQRAYTRATLVTPLLGFSIWSYWQYNKHYWPVNHYIALQSVREAHNDLAVETGEYPADESEEGFGFNNPSLVSPLESVWVNRRASENDAEATVHDGYES